ncbi:glycosyltransferase, partial [Desulfovibrio sp. OttesenSCG-928-F20]|nr:glycosyltransferase [Desulfovibrio sp. OttesenSCG-928-F20]
MHIGIVVWSLFEHRGGIERCGCDLASHMLAHGHEVTIFYRRPDNILKNKSAYPLPKEVRLCALKLDYDTIKLDAARAALAAANPDVLAALFSWESLLWFPALLQGTAIPLLVSEHSSPENINRKWNAYERHCCLETADAIHVLQQSFVDDYPKRLHERIYVIGNAAFIPDKSVLTKVTSGRKTILGVGRFTESVKQFSLPPKHLYPAWPIVADIRSQAPAFWFYLFLRLPGATYLPRQHIFFQARTFQALLCRELPGFAVSQR